MSDKVSKKDIPTADEMREPYLQALKSGRSKSISTVDKEVATALGLSTAQRNYTIKGSATTLLSNRLKSTRILLQNDGLVTSTKLGKVKLTEAGKYYLENKEDADEESTEQTTEEDARRNTDEETDVTSSTTEKSDADTQTTPKPMLSKNLRTTSVDNQNETQRPTQDAAQQPQGDASQPKAPTPEPRDETTSHAPADSTTPTDTTTPPQPTAPSSLINLRNGIIAAAALILIVVIFIAATCANNSSTPPSQTQTQTQTQTSDASTESTTPTELPALSFVVNAASVSDSNVTAVVYVTGETLNGAKVNSRFTEKVGTPHEVEFGAGTYVISLAESEITNGSRVFKHDAAKVVYSGEKSVEVELNLSIDEALTQTKTAEAEEQARAAAEQARLEAEQKAQAEQQQQEAIEAARKAATVALTNSLADDVFASDGNTHDPSRYHSFSDRSGFYLELLQDGAWSKKNDSTYHVTDIKFSIPNSQAQVKASLDVSFDGTSYTISNVTGMLAVPGKESTGTNMSTYEKSQPDGSSALNVPLSMLE